MGNDAITSFLNGFKAGWEMMPSKDEREYNEAKAEYTKAMAEYYRGRGDNSSRDANYTSLHEDRVERRKETARHNRAMEANGGKSKRDPYGFDDPDLIDALPENDDRMEGLDDPVEEDVESGAIPTVGTQPTDFYSRGGTVAPPPKRRKRVMRYANGGGVVSEEEDQPPMPGTMQPVPAIANQTGAPPPAIPPSGADPAAGQPKPGPGFSYTAAVDAAKAAIEATTKDPKAGAPEEAVPTGQGGDGAADPDQVEELRRRFDPEKKLSFDQVNSKILGSVWETYIKLGEPEKATKAAAGLYKHYKAMNNRWLAIADQAAKGGKVDEAAMALLKSYAYVPDGHEVELQKLKSGKFAMKMTDQKTGQVVRKALFPPEQILSMATRGGIPTMEELIMQGGGHAKLGLPAPVSPTAQAEQAGRGKRAATERVDAAIGTGNGTEENPFRVTSQEELDQLDAGTWIIVNGRKGQIKPKAAPKAE